MYIRGNDAPFMNKNLSKEIMKRSNLRNKYLKSRNEDHRQSYAKTKKFMLISIKKAKKELLFDLKQTS